MPPRQVACDPCRFSKLACDHSRPVCSRCLERDQATDCTYRDRPFKRRKIVDDRHSASPSGTGISLSIPPSTSRNYPNAGYLGASSHNAIFASFDEGGEAGYRTRDPSEALQSAAGICVDEDYVQHGAKLIQHIRDTLQIELCQRLVQMRMLQGVNLALAGVFIEGCAHTAVGVLNKASPGIQESEMSVSRRLFVSSCRSLELDENATAEDFQAKFCGEHARWETLGLFFTAVGKATTDVVSFESLYNTEKQRRDLRRFAMQFSDCCLEIALSLDCLNDLQLILQYENFILHASVNGDQSYHSWRRLGDVISSLFALGYHEQINNKPPQFLSNLRKAAFARAYSADKNIAVFLGRPPRLHRKYSNIQLPDATNNIRANGVTAGTVSHEASSGEWPRAGHFEYLVDTRWSFLCALLKGDILELLRETNEDERNEKAKVIQAEAEAQWAALPADFRLQGALKLYDRRPIECDFMLSARLNHLHVLLLLRLAVLRQLRQPDAQLLNLASNMLGLTVEGILLRDRLANSGTSLAWRVAYYGLPAAGIVCLALLNRSFSSNDVSLAEVIQNLNVLVAEVESGAFVSFEHPNYSVLSHAAQTIKNVLGRMLSGEITNDSMTSNVSAQTRPDDQEDWMPWVAQDSWDFEIDFWRNLAEHPTLAELDSAISGLL